MIVAICRITPVPYRCRHERMRGMQVFWEENGRMVGCDFSRPQIGRDRMEEFTYEGEEVDTLIAEAVGELSKELVPPIFRDADRDEVAVQYLWRRLHKLVADALRVYDESLR